MRNESVKYRVVKLVYEIISFTLLYFMLKSLGVDSNGESLAAVIVSSLFFVSYIHVDMYIDNKFKANSKRNVNVWVNDCERQCYK